MKTTFFCFVFLSLSTAALSQNWQWANRIGSNCDNGVDRFETGSGFTDGSNYYLMGYFPWTLFTNTTTLHSNDELDVYIVKYNSEGQELWAKNINSGWNYYFFNPKYNPITQSIYIGGTFSGVWILGTDTLIANNITCSIFLGKLDMNGNVLWGKTFSGKHEVAKLFIKPNGDLMLFGSVFGTTVFDTISFDEGGFLATFDTSGGCKWVSNNIELSSAISSLRVIFIGTDIVITGSHGYPVSFGNSTIYPQNNDGFIARLDSIGNLKWLKTISGPGKELITGLTSDSLNNIYISGSFTDSALIFNNSMVYDAGKEVNLAKLDPDGNLIWFKQIHNTGNIATSVISQIRNNEFYVSGSFSGSASFGNFFMETAYPQDMFLARYDTSGECLAVTHFGEAGGSVVNFDNNGNILCDGIFWNTVSIASSQFTAYARYDHFVAKTGPLSRMEVPKSQTDETLHIYSNPTTGVCTIELPDSFKQEKMLVLCVNDVTGKQILNKNLNMQNGNISLDMNFAAKGMYQVSLSNYQKTYIGRVIFQ